jgi:ATP-binding protein involved in chromosome partitioning
MRYTQADILKALSTVEDPDLKRDLVSLGMIKDLQVTPEKIAFTVVLTTPACPLKEKIKSDCLEAVRKLAGADVVVDITMTSSVTTFATMHHCFPRSKILLPSRPVREA